MNLFYQPDISTGNLHLDADESRHAITVLRMHAGDVLHLTDGKGAFYQAAITEANPKKCTFTILNKEIISPRPYHISIAVAPTKNIDRMEWFVEKAIEIGVDKIYFILCQNSERKVLNTDRINKIAISAMKQSGQSRLPELTDMVRFRDILQLEATQKFICYVDVKNPNLLKTLATPHSNYLVLIGPEGDFSTEEVKLAQDNGFKKVSLGPNRLRTETAALTACQMLNFINL